MDIAGKTIWQQAAGDTDRNYSESAEKGSGLEISVFLVATLHFESGGRESHDSRPDPKSS
jgi:hypothetical protein